MSSSDESSHRLFISNFLTRTFGAPDDFTIEKNTRATNNHVYMICFANPTTSELTSSDGSLKPFTSPIPAVTSRLVMRIPKPDNNMEGTIRICNEVAFLALARRALADANPLLIPRVFSWDDTTISDSVSSQVASPSYILEEFKVGEEITWDELRTLSEEAVSSICKQFARIVKALQAYKLPEGITGYGGITFDNAGNLSSAKGIFRTGGPFSTYGEYLKATLKWQLEQSESVETIQGWRHVPEMNDLRQRIDPFLSEGLDPLLSTVPEHRPTLVHGDLTLPNLLFDRSTNSIVAIVDFDFGHVGSPLTEFLYSFPEFHGILLGVAEPEDSIRDLVLNGFAGDVGPTRRIGKMWAEALAAEDVQRPTTIEGAETVSDIWWFGQELLQFHWMIPAMLQNMPAEQRNQSCKKSAERIQTYLTHWGY